MSGHIHKYSVKLKLRNVSKNRETDISEKKSTNFFTKIIEVGKELKTVESYSKKCFSPIFSQEYLKIGKIFIFSQKGQNISKKYFSNIVIFLFVSNYKNTCIK